jgi:general secretion pathway protein D
MGQWWVRGRFACAVVLALVGVGPAAAQTPPTGRDPYAPGRRTEAPPIVPGPAGVISSLELDNTPVTAAFKMISDLTGWSIITTDAVAAKPPTISVWIKNMPPEDALNEIGRLAGLVVKRDANVVHVLTFGEYAELYGMQREVIPLENASAPELVAILSRFVDEKSDARVLADASGNRVVLLVPASVMDSLKHLIAALDAPTGRDEVKVRRIEHLTATELAPVLEQFALEGGGRNSFVPGAPANSGGAVTPTGTSALGKWNVHVVAEPTLNALIIRGRTSDVARAMALVDELDVSPGLEVVNVPLRYTNATQVAETLPAFVNTRTTAGATKPRLHLGTSEQNNCLVVEASPIDLAWVRQLIEAIDRPLPPGTGGIRVFRLENAAAEEVAAVLRDLIDEKSANEAATAERVKRGSAPPAPWSPTTPAPPTQPPEPKPAEPPTTPPSAADSGETPAAPGRRPARVTVAAGINALIVRASAGELAELEEVIAELDRPREQVVLEVTLVSVTSTNGFNLGVELSGSAVNGHNIDTLGLTTFGVGTQDAQAGTTRLSAQLPFGINYAVFNSDDLSLVLNALQTVGDTRIQSAPRIVVEDNAEATISQLTQEPYEAVNQGQTTTTTSFGGFVDAGTRLLVTPQISSYNWLRVSYAIEFSSFGTRTAQQLAANLPPPRTSNTVAGTLRVPSDYTIAIGGLVSRRDDKTADQVPFVGDVPLLGLLFKNQSTSSSHQTLFIFIRPTILRDPLFFDLINLSEQEIRRAKLTREDHLVNPLVLMRSGAKEQP